MAALSELVEELQDRTGIVGQGTCLPIAAHLPLIHRCGDPIRLLENLDDSPELLPGAGSANREELGMGGRVFQWLGSCAYPEAKLALIWSPAHVSAVATWGLPWDTGGLMTKGTLGRVIDVDQERRMIERYRLVGSEYREFLALVLECSFATAVDYIAGQLPENWYPGWVTPRAVLPSPPCHTFEVSSDAPFPIKPELIAAVIEEGAFANHSRLLAKFRKYLRSCGADYIQYEQNQRPDQAVKDYVMQFLVKIGVL